jgi:hypothetical protein
MSTSPTPPPAAGSVSTSPTPQSPAGSASSDDVEDNNPEHITIQLNLRKLPALAAHNRKLGDLPDPPTWRHSCKEDTFHILCARIRGCIPTNLPGVRWPIDGQPYVKPSKHATAKLFQLLDEDNYLDSLRKAWKMEIKRGVSPADVVVHIFAYVQYPEARAGAPVVNTGEGNVATIHRATASRKAAAGERIQQAIDTGQLQTPGPITRIFLTQRMAQDARLPEPDEPVTNTATFRQAQHLDSQKEQLDRRREAEEEEHVSKYQKLEVRIQGAVLAFEVNVENLRSILGLPQHGLDGIGRLEQVTLPRPQGDMEDIDHEDSD